MTDGNIMTPNPAAESGQQAAANNQSLGEGVPSQTPLPDENSHLDVISVADTRMEGNRVIVIVESENTDRLMSTDAKNLAYAQRFRYGMTNSGIEALSGIFVAPGESEKAQEEDRAVRMWQREFKLTPGL